MKKAFGILGLVLLALAAGAAGPVVVSVAVSNVTGLGTGIATALGINVGSAGAPVTFNGAGGTPSSITLTNGTGLPIAGTNGYGAGVATALGIAVGSAGGPVTNGGALGTPSSGAMTNLTGLAATERLKSGTITVTRDLTAAGGSVAYTGMGFQPTACFARGMVAATATQYYTSAGNSDSALNQSASFLQGGVYSISSGLILLAYDATGANGQYFTITSYGADGFTGTWSKAGTPTGTFTSYFMCLR